MTLADLLREPMDVDCHEVWENERTLTPVQVSGLGLAGLDRLYGAFWTWTHRLTEEQGDPPMDNPSRVAVYDTGSRL